MSFKRARCAHCKGKLEAERPGQKIHAECASDWIEAQKAKEARMQEKAEKARIRVAKEAIKTIPQLIKEAQVEFNAYIRARDAGKPCICCGRGEAQGYGLASHGFDCGNFRSTGSASHLRFNEDNAHRQLVICNRHGAGRAVDYRMGLIHRIGLERVDALERNNKPHHWTREELREIKATYREKRKELLKKSE